LNYII